MKDLKNKVLGIGEVVIDKTILLSNYLKEGEKFESKASKVSVGGPVASALTVLSRLGADCTMIASLGNDKEGRIIRKYLTSEKIKLFSFPAERTKSNLVIVNEENGSRTIIHGQKNADQITSLPEDFLNEAEVILFDRHEPAAFDFVVKNKRNKTKLIIDPSCEVSEKTLRMIKRAEYPILPIESLDLISKNTNLSEQLKKLYKLAKKPVIITMGEKGSLVYDGRKAKLAPALKIKTVDTTGAGDVYRGAFAWGVLKNWSLYDCALFANVVGGLQCSRLGNGSAIPTKREIYKAYKLLHRSLKTLSTNI